MRCERQDLLTTPGELAPCLGDPRLRIVDCRFDLMAPDAGREVTAIREAIPARVK